MAKTPTNDLHVSLTQSPDAHKGPKALQQALGLVITDKESRAAVHQAGTQWKMERKKVEAYYRTEANGTGIINPLYTAYKAALKMMESHLKPFDEAIAMADRVEVEWVQAQKRLEAEEHERQRAEAERQETERRRKDAEKAEREALKLEASSNILSEREQKFVRAFVAHDQKLDILSRLVTQLGYKDIAYGTRLLAMPKIQQAIENVVKADRLRAEAASRQSAPIILDVATKPSEVVDGGLRTYYSVGRFDVKQALTQIATRYGADGEELLTAAVDRYLAKDTASQDSALRMFLSDQARSLKELFEGVWAGATLAKRDGTTTR